MPEDIQRWDLSTLNQFFLQKSREFREGIRAGKQPEELQDLYYLMNQLYSEMRERRFAYVPGNKGNM
jgi:hypothetical protein